MAGTFTENGLNIVLNRLYGTSKSAPSGIRVGTSATAPSESDSVLNNLVPLTPTTINVCDTPGDWTEGADSITPTKDTVNFKQGYNTTDDTSLNIGKDGTSSTEISYYDTLSLDLSGTKPYIWGWLYIKDATELAKLEKAQIRIEDASANYRLWDFAVANLATGWNLLSTGVISSYTEQSASAPALASITKFYLKVFTTLSATTITLGDLKMDFLHYDLYANTDTAFTSTSINANLSQVQGFISAAEANGYPLREVGEFNTDSTPILVTHDTHTLVDKTDEIQINYIFVHEASNG